LIRFVAKLTWAQDDAPEDTADNGDAPLNLSMKSVEMPATKSKLNALEFGVKAPQKSLESVNNLNSLQNLTAGIGFSNTDIKRKRCLPIVMLNLIFYFKRFIKKEDREIWEEESRSLRRTQSRHC